MIAITGKEFAEMVGISHKSKTAKKQAWYVFRTAHNIPFVPGTRSCSRALVEKAINKSN